MQAKRASLISKKFASLMLLAVCALAMTACAPKSSKKESALVNGYRLIDSHQFDQAISYFEALLDQNPENDEYRAALASAYADRAGVRVQTLAPVIQSARDLGSLDEKPKTDDKAKSSGAKTDLLIMNFSGLLGKLSKAANLYASIPSIEIENRIYLVHAIQLLENLHEVSQTNALYRGLLRVVLFKSSLTSSIAGELPHKTLDPGTCSFQISQASDRAIELGRMLIHILEDVSIADPRQAKSLGDIENQIADDVSGLTMGMTAVMLVDDSTKQILKRSVIENNFGTLLKCGDEHAP